MSTQSIVSVLAQTDPRRWRILVGAGVAICSSVVALGLTLMLPGSSSRPTLVLCAAAIFVSTWVGRWSGALLSTAFCLAGGAYFLFEPHGSLHVTDKAHLIHFVVSALVFIALAVVVQRRPTTDDFILWVERMERLLPRRDKGTRLQRTPYDLFASVYGKHFGVETSKRLLPVHEELLLRRVPSNCELLDLCCGSGQLAAALSSRGFHVTGIDNSAEMLRLARSNAPSADFLLADARFFQLPQAYSGALCTFNSLAHIHRGSDLEAVFRNVYRCLLPGGLFLFDLFMEEAYLRRWRGSFSVVEDGQVCIVDATYDPETRAGRNDITVFELERQWKRADLTLFQKCHREEDVIAALQSAAFSDIRHYDGGRDFHLENEEGRAFFVTRKT